MKGVWKSRIAEIRGRNEASKVWEYREDSPLTTRQDIVNETSADIDFLLEVIDTIKLGEEE